LPDQINSVDPEQLKKNPNNPRRYFNDEKLDQLRTSLQETGVLVPLIVYEEPSEPGRYVLMDGERRWRSALDLGFSEVPVRVIPAPSELDNLLQMFNIHSVREEWSLVAIALALREVIRVSGENHEGRLAELTGLTRSTVRRARRLLDLPMKELDLIQGEAHLDRTEQVHREDLYLEIDAAESVLRRNLPEVGGQYTRPKIIRQFAKKREQEKLPNVTDFRYVAKLVKAASSDLISRQSVIDAANELIQEVSATPADVFERVAAAAVGQQEIARKAELLTASIETLPKRGKLSARLRSRLEVLRAEIADVLGPSDDR
jgi:ParB family transcriptional regulator, chromosome partitioning protein